MCVCVCVCVLQGGGPLPVIWSITNDGNRRSHSTDSTHNPGNGNSQTNGQLDSSNSGTDLGASLRAFLPTKISARKLLPTLPTLTRSQRIAAADAAPPRPPASAAVAGAGRRQVHEVCDVPAWRVRTAAIPAHKTAVSAMAISSATVVTASDAGGVKVSVYDHTCKRAHHPALCQYMWHEMR